MFDELHSFEEWRPQPPVQILANGAINGTNNPVTYPITRRGQLDAVFSIISGDNLVPLCKQWCELCVLVPKTLWSYGHFARGVPKF